MWRNIFFLAAFFPLVASANGGHPHEPALPSTGGVSVVEETSVRDGLVVNMNITPLPVMTGTPARFDFLVNEKPDNEPVSFYELDVEHTKLMHVVGVRDDLNEFLHVHPEPSPDNPAIFTAAHVFEQYGSYTFWSEISRGGTHFIFKHPEIAVSPATTSGHVVPPLTPSVSLARNVIVGDYQVALTVPGHIPRGRQVDLTFDVHTFVGDGVAFEEYLGVPMHLIAVKDDRSQFAHTHPNEAHAHTFNTHTPIAYAHGRIGDAPSYEPANFHFIFPTAGFYKLFAQFRPQGSGLAPDTALTASFWVEVEDNAITPATGRLVVAAVSLILMVLLSFGVYRYLHWSA